MLVPTAARSQSADVRHPTSLYVRGALTQRCRSPVWAIHRQDARNWIHTMRVPTRIVGRHTLMVPLIVDGTRPRPGRLARGGLPLVAAPGEERWRDLRRMSVGPWASGTGTGNVWKRDHG